MAQLIVAAVLTLYGLWAVFFDGRLDVIALLTAFGGGIWLLICIIRYATRPRRA